MLLLLYQCTCRVLVCTAHDICRTVDKQLSLLAHLTLCFTRANYISSLLLAKIGAIWSQLLKLRLLRLLLLLL